MDLGLPLKVLKVASKSRLGIVALFIMSVSYFLNIILTQSVQPSKSVIICTLVAFTIMTLAVFFAAGRERPMTITEVMFKVFQWGTVFGCFFTCVCFLAFVIYVILMLVLAAQAPQ